MISHRLPARVRLRVPQCRGNTAWFDTTVVELAMVRGVRAASANPRLGTILVELDGPWESVASKAAARGLFVLAAAQAMAEPAMKRLGAELTGLEQTLGGDGRTLLFALLMGLGLVQIARGVVLPPALSLAAYALALALNPSAAAERD
jgi:hypothetical protein